MPRGLLAGLLTLVVVVVVLGLLGNVGGVELGLAVVVAAVVGWLVARRNRRHAQTADPVS
jgi:Na+/H+ antiporter NhaD/arsenite permease-like protein